ncbi:MAG: LysR family transcriptional regulator [Pseudomonadota bacterium]
MSTVPERRFVMELDWNLLRTFVVIVEEGGITAAGDRIRLSQPAVSLALKRLESHVGARLVDRGGGVFRVTATGRDLYRDCRDLFDDIARIQHTVRESAREISGLVRIALATHVVTPLLDETLRAFSSAHPRVIFRLAVASSSAVGQAVLDNDASLGVCLVSHRLKRLDYQMIYREFFGFYCGPTHPLFGRDGLGLADLRGFPVVSFDTDDANDALRPIALLRQRYGLEQQVVGYSNHLEEVRRMILCGLGFGPLPLHIAERDVRDGLLWRLPPYDDPPAIDIWMVTNPSTRRNRAEAALIAALAEAIEATPLAERTYATAGQGSPK